MEIKKSAQAGTLESGDILIEIEKSHQKGITVQLKSTVANQFGKQIKKVIVESLEIVGVDGVFVNAVDKGALDCTIKARVLTAVFRAAEKTCPHW